MTVIPGSISAQPQATAAAASDRIPVDQEVGAVVGAAAMEVGNAYQIVALGTGTNWAAAGAGTAPAPGLVFVCQATAAGTGTVQQLVTRHATVEQIASLAQSPPTDLGYVPATRELTSSTGEGVILPLAGEYAGLLAPAGEGRNAQLSGLTLASLTVTGTATLSDIHGALTGPVYEHVRNTSGAPLSALTPYRVASPGTQGATDRVTITAARGDTPALMPASGILAEPLANNGDGQGIVGGVIQGVNTAGLLESAPLWVAPTGGLTTVRPSTGLVQLIGVVGRVHASTGSIVVLPGPALAALAYTGSYGDLSGVPGPRELRSAVSGWSGGQMYVYLANAPGGTADTASGWEVIRRTVSTAGAIIGTATAQGAWSNYPNLVYV